jgi:Protein of unknown function (DUF3592)
MESAINFGPNIWFGGSLILFMVLLLLVQIRYLVRQVRSRDWPVIDATIQKGPTGMLNDDRRGNGMPAWFVGYSFKVNNSIYTGRFALYGNSGEVDRVRRDFPAGSIRVKYDPANPNISFLKESKDSRFGRLTPTQNPGQLKHFPSFDLQDLIRD